MTKLAVVWSQHLTDLDRCFIALFILGYILHVEEAARIRSDGFRFPAANHLSLLKVALEELN